jgi:sugar-specific transcriptional regulator TrmB
MENLATILSKIGLSEREAQVYVALLDLGPSGVVALSRKTGLNRPMVYNVLNDLKKRGLVEVEFFGIKSKFAAANPDQFDALIQEHRRLFDVALPELLAKYKLRGSKSQIKYYEGFEGVKTVYERVLRETRSGDFYYVMSDQDNWVNKDITWLEDWITRRARTQLDARIILPDSKRNRYVKSMDGAWSEETRLISKPLRSDIVIYPGAYVINSLSEPVGSIVIENEEAIATQKEIFEYLWDSLPTEMP